MKYIGFILLAVLALILLLLLIAVIRTLLMPSKTSRRRVRGRVPGAGT
jgi:uncharacterized protein HemY